MAAYRGSIFNSGLCMSKSLPVVAQGDSRNCPTICIVVPCYNEEAVLRKTASCLESCLSDLEAKGRIVPSGTIIFVDDGSSDSTWELIEAICQQSTRVQGIKLAHNRGHQNALLAGLEHADTDVVITIDADLQDDVGAISKMIAAYSEGAEVVYGVRDRRDTDSFFKRITAEGFYRCMRFLGVNVVFNHADFRLMSRRAILALGRYTEVNLFIRAMVPMLGFRTAVVTYPRAHRLAGESKYTLFPMLSFALTGITSFSLRPLRLITMVGFVVAAIASFVGLWAIVAALTGSASTPGWASLLLVISFLGGAQLFAIGVVGEYVGRIYLEVKRRPRYEVEAFTEGVYDKVKKDRLKE